MTEWQLTVGLEIHVQLKTKTKMFCGCKNDPFHSEPNTNVCPVCYGLPGALPTLNKRAIELVVEFGQAIGAKISPETFWARKNYFYPDLPKGYQISQSTEPLITGGVVSFEGRSYHLNHAHLEEDAGKLIHQSNEDFSLVDYNRAGTPLLEIVTEPDFHTAAEAKRFCQELQRIMRHLEASDADMEKGQMRCEANISVAPSNWQPATGEIAIGQRPEARSQKLGTKVEVKNINSFRNVERAIEYEFARQTDVLEGGGKVEHETRTWNDADGRTILMRSKETSADYRYFPEPDLPRVKIEVGTKKLSKLPEAQRAELEALGVSRGLAEIIVDKGWQQILLALVGRNKQLVREAATALTDYPNFAKLSLDNQETLLKVRHEKGWTKVTFSQVIDDVLGGKSLDEAAVGDEFDLEQVVKDVIAANAMVVNDFKAGKAPALNFLVGQVMAKTKGQANIQNVRKELEGILK
ncbi:hypothetical protein A3A71_01375 [Candidatus Berkelbacteria bacterium RIFCSPLOWO2_01_FULL_50_28]|uniref:Aspartyl/glutamyl-tRNA(Asn/Gln) amidotransferase subunit B n=1 Tax=Candidatus Berkelbacteria bacterium RIFCSPLOWO2_01_FULL_50_28 TaxID=1797471 RepID=A0A1F5EBA1_9BACT|nr:MAG: hypothetical protein A2807_01945 [Candidatus Berkelbacteria bacterium RIFCSPHIGHO2_01_FULL_50_36]OGD64001.1 MAG: hypothetical protein A3F39_02925 [Candidatus Berkelbacteria bacterium RIFCSPHIGHO2_12_FULL_50_11]OGD64688.1 MAG: hypothetical protein A3A71_01375 [Candidatus Berkelbacteria bacterium RIFCSPLOWO2_01_FULL_50_28]